MFVFFSPRSFSTPFVTSVLVVVACAMVTLNRVISPILMTHTNYFVVVNTTHAEHNANDVVQDSFKKPGSSLKLMIRLPANVIRFMNYLISDMN